MTVWLADYPVRGLSPSYHSLFLIRLLNFSGNFSRITWNRWAMEASCKVSDLLFYRLPNTENKSREKNGVLDGKEVIALNQRLQCWSSCWWCCTAAGRLSPSFADPLLAWFWWTTGPYRPKWRPDEIHRCQKKSGAKRFLYRGGPLDLMKNFVKALVLVASTPPKASGQIVTSSQWKHRDGWSAMFKQLLHFIWRILHRDLDMRI